MSDDTNNRGAQDRARVAVDQPYEVEYFARKHGLTMEQARELIERVGNSRAKLDAAAEQIKASAERT